MTIKLSINGKQVSVDDGSTVLDAINRSGAYISQLCKDPDMKAIGACRTCLVQIEGMRGLPASCSVPAEQGMSVLTETDEPRETRRGVLELTMAMFPKNGEADLSGLPRAFYRRQTPRHRHPPLDGPRARAVVDASNPVFQIAMDSCIMCGRCAQACQDGHQFIGAIDILGTGTQKPA